MNTRKTDRIGIILLLLVLILTFAFSPLMAKNSYALAKNWIFGSKQTTEKNVTFGWIKNGSGQKYMFISELSEGKQTWIPFTFGQYIMWTAVDTENVTGKYLVVKINNLQNAGVNVMPSLSYNVLDAEGKSLNPPELFVRILLPDIADVPAMISANGWREGANVVEMTTPNDKVYDFICTNVAADENIQLNESGNLVGTVMVPQAQSDRPVNFWVIGGAAVVLLAAVAVAVNKKAKKQ